MSLLLDALNKTSGRSKSADKATPDANIHSEAALAANDSPAPEQQPTAELSLQAIDAEQLNDAELNAVESATEIDADVEFDEDEFAALLESEHQLSAQIQHAANEATIDADEILTQHRIDELSDEIASMPSVSPLSAPVMERVEASDKDTPSVELKTEQSSTINNNSEQKQQHNNIEATAPITSEDDNGKLLIEAAPEPESLAMEMLQDAPLVQAYSQAQKKRQKLLLLGAMSLMLITVLAVYKTFMVDAAAQQAASSFDPVLAANETGNSNTVVLEEIAPDTIPKRLSFPESATTTTVPENVVRVVLPARTSSADALRAHTALKQGRLDQAKRLYTRMAGTERNKVAALSGLASVAIANNELLTARAHLRHVLSLDRHNAWALATLAALPKTDNDNTAPGNSVSTLKSMRLSEPDNDQIAYLLGNKFAAAGMWAEAQATYFDAFAIDSNNANYAFNLAIALDHLGKVREAAEFYKQALHLAETRGADFDTRLLRQRLQHGDK